MSSRDELPRLACLADVNVQGSCHGALQLFRLLSGCPPEKLLIIETSWNCSEPERRLPGVSYRHYRPWWTRVFHQSRFPGLAPWLAKLAVLRWREISRQLASFHPRSLLTVAHGFSWIAASEFAQHSKLPLHLIVHDDWPRHPTFSPSVSERLDAVFGTYYRGATSRMCVSPFMEEAYRTSYGVAGTVLYPTRSQDLKVATAPPPRLGAAVQNLTVAFAGTLHPGQIAPMRTMVDVLRPMNGRLLLFGPMTRTELASAGLSGEHVGLRGMLSPNALIEAVRHEVDVLYAPVSFEEQWRGNSSLGFPSKLTDYSAAGLPILIHGPPWASAVRWARQESRAAMVVDTETSHELTAALTQLQEDRDSRLAYGGGALESGQRYFSARAADRLFRSCLEQPNTASLPT